MPNRDGTGPEGEGPKTGRGMGNCFDDLEKKRREQEETLDKLGRGRRRRPLRDGGGRGKGPGLARRNRRGRPD